MFTDIYLRLDRMEGVVLGTKRTIPFWRAKRPRLALERALSSLRDLGPSSAAMRAPALAHSRARSRLDAEAKKLGRFPER
jgi:hypothetical protein